jgi:hypothetical protein
MLTLAKQRFGMKRDTMAYSLGQAAKAAGISKTSLHRAIQKGRVSAAKNDNGSYEIEPSELHRVYPAVTQTDRSANPDLGEDGTLETPIETAVLRREVQLLHERLADKETVIADLKERLDQSEQERRDKDRQLTALLTDHRHPELQPVPTAAPEPPPRKGFRRWLHRITS